MSARNETVNRLAQGSALYGTLNARERRTLVALLKYAYTAGRAAGQADTTAD